MKGQDEAATRLDLGAEERSGQRWRRSTQVATATAAANHTTALINGRPARSARGARGARVRGAALGDTAVLLRGDDGPERVCLPAAFTQHGTDVTLLNANHGRCSRRVSIIVPASGPRRPKDNK